MGKLQRGVQKFFKSGRPASEELREESFDQASTSVNTEPPSQTVPKEQTKAELSGTLASREESFANENWREMDAAEFNVHARGWPSDNLPSTLRTGHASRPLPEPESAASSAATSNTAPNENQGKKAATEDQVHVGTKEMENVLVGLVGRLYKMAEGNHPFADRFEKAPLNTKYHKVILWLKQGSVELFTFVHQERDGFAEAWGGPLKEADCVVDSNLLDVIPTPLGEDLYYVCEYPEKIPHTVYGSAGAKKTMTLVFSIREPSRLVFAFTLT